MPDQPFDARPESLKFVGASYEGDAICFGPTKSRPLPESVSPIRYASDSDDSGKAVVVKGNTDVSGVTGKQPMNVASSSSTAAETEDIYNNLASDSSSQHDEAEAEDTTDVPEAEDKTDALPMLMRTLAITPMNESEYWRNREPRLFEDTPEQASLSSGLGIHELMRLMELPEEPQHDAPADRHEVQEPEEMFMPSTSIVTFQVPGFSMSLAGRIVPFAEEQFVEDVGLENLDIVLNP